jgi:hypothetical protein
MICLHCDNEILETDSKQMVGLDVPYLNIWFHRGCYNLFVKSEINEYLRNNVQKIENMVQLESKINNKGRR